MPRRRRKPAPELLVVDANVVIDDVGRNEAARGLVEALAQVRFGFAIGKTLKKEYEQLRKQMRTHILLSVVLAQLYAKQKNLERRLRPLPRLDLGSWDRPADDHLLQLALAANNCPVLTSELANLGAKQRVREALDVDVHDVDGGWTLARNGPRRASTR
jgi:rRNA-processing protein FCF1